MSSKTPLYTYTDRNLLDEPEYYMYGAYKGEPFLYEFVSLRTEYATELEKRYLARLQHDDRVDVYQFLSAWRPLLSAAGETFSTEVQAIHTSYSEGTGSAEEPPAPSRFSLVDMDTLTEIPTQHVLRTLLLSVVDRDASTEDTLYRWLSRFVQRFEVTKKLYTVYTPKMHPASQDFHILTNHALLSLGLVLYYEQTDNLKMLNGTLKLNDLLCSAQAGLNQSEDLFFTVLALRKELRSVKQLASRHRIVL